MLLRVVLHQLCQSGKLLTSVKVVVVPRILDLNVGDLIISPNQEVAVR